jgi:hypothetical protein
MPRYTDKEIMDALRATKGMVYVAAQHLGCDPRTIKGRVAKSQRIRDVLEAERGKMGDTAELKLAQAIQNGEPWAIQFYLKTQAKDRGYTERIDITHSVREYANQLANELGLDPDDVVAEAEAILKAGVK